MKKLIGLVVMTSAALLLTACSSSVSSTNLDAAAFSQKTTETGVITLDVRTQGEYMMGHIKGAINIDVEGPAFESEIAKLDKSATYAVYCQSGRRSGIAVEAMHHLGFNNLLNLTNGIIDWQTQGLPLVTS